MYLQISLFQDLKQELELLVKMNILALLGDSIITQPEFLYANSILLKKIKL